MNAGILKTFQYLVQRQVPPDLSSIFFVWYALRVYYFKIIPACQLSHHLHQGLIIKIEYAILPGNVLFDIGRGYLPMRESLAWFKQHFIYADSSFQQAGLDMIFV